MRAGANSLPVAGVLRFTQDKYAGRALRRKNPGASDKAIHSLTSSITETSGVGSDVMAELNLQEIHDFAVALAKEAGAMILAASNTRLSSKLTAASEKKNCIAPRGGRFDCSGGSGY
jgi:hypothetical protein